MKISTETIGRLYASGRNYINLGLGFAAGVGIVSAGQQKEIMDSITEIYNGVAMIAHGGTSLWTILSVIAAPIIGPILARMASNSAKIDSQAAAVQAAITDPNTPVSVEAKVSIVNATAKLPEVEKVVAPELAPIPATDPAVVVR